MARRQPPIPYEILHPAMKAIQLTTKHDIDRWDEPLIYQLRESLGPDYAYIPAAELRRIGSNYRKSGRLGAEHGHGPRKGSGGGHTGKNKGATCSPKQ